MQTLKYQINEPCVIDVLVKDKYASISWSVENGTDEIKVDLNENEKGTLLFDFGDTSNIRYGGTDNWGKDLLPIYLDYEKDACSGDSVYVDDLIIQEYAGENNWCKCYKLANGAIMYLALSENKSKNSRTAYFKHRTTDDKVKRGFYAGRPAAPEWYVTIILEGNPSGSVEIVSDSLQETKIYDFDEWLDIFNKTILLNNKKQISKNSNTYSYLKKMFDAAVDEFNKNSHNLFNLDIFNDIYNYHGNNNKFEKNGMSLNIICSWILAMCLSELMPTTGKLSNIQTEFFKLAYDSVGGRKVPLYDDYTLKSDPMILRLVAGAVYSIIRSNYSFEYINNLRKELGVSYINASNWSGLQYSSSDSKSIKNIGYIVNSDAIIPSAPGPYTNDSDPNRPKPWDEGLSKDLFYMLKDDKDWHLYNYKKDVEIDDYVVKNYNMGSYTYDSNKGKGVWETYDKAKRLLMLQAATMPFANDHYFFGSKRIKFDGVKYVKEDNFWRYYFVETTEKVTDDNNVFDIIGPFALFESKMFTSGYDITSNMKFFQNIMDIADNSRYPTYHTEYGRRRPLGGETPGTCRAGEINGHPLNGILAGTIGCLFADNEAGYTKRKNCDDFPHDGPRTYPSGHATMTWTVAMILSQMDPKNTVKYMTEAYKIGVGRVIARFHWNSDTIYGRLFGTFIMPIINAMKGILNSYNLTKKSLTEKNTINIEICNNTNKSVSLLKKVNFVLENPDSCGNYYGWLGIYNRYAIINESAKINIPAKSSYKINDISIDNIDRKNCPRNFLDINKQHDKTSYKTQSNVFLYDVNGISENIISRGFSKDTTIESGKTYIINID